MTAQRIPPAPAFASKDWTHALDALPAAEIAYAAFNARRTSSDEDAVATGATQAFAWVLDASRPTHRYYNRAFARAADAATPGGLARLPAGVVAIETRPSDVSPASAALLVEQGFRPVYTLCYLVAFGPTAPTAPPRTVERLAHASTDTFFDLLEQEGVPFPPEKRTAKRVHYCTDEFEAWVAKDDEGRIAAWATSFVGEGFAFLGNSFTLPAFRGHGLHAALLSARLTSAFARGVRVVYADVEHGSQSHLNCERAGMRTLTIDTIWARPMPETAA